MNINTTIITAALALTTAHATAGVTGLGFLSLNLETESFGEFVFFDTGDVNLNTPSTYGYSAIETDQGFAELYATISVGGGVSRIQIDGMADSDSVGGFSFEAILQVPEATTFFFDDTSYFINFEPESAGSGNIDFDNEIIEAGTYRISTDGFYYGESFDWLLQLEGEYNLVPAPATAALLLPGAALLTRRRRA